MHAEDCRGRRHRRPPHGPRPRAGSRCARPRDPARSRAASMLSDACVRAATRRPRTRSEPSAGRRPAPGDPARRAAARCPAATAAARGPAATATCRCSGSSSAGRATQTPAGVSTCSPPVAARIAASSGSLAPRSRYSAAVGATSPSVRPSGRRPGPGLRHAHRVGAALEGRDRRLVHARRHLAQVDGRGLEVRPHERHAGRVEVARRAVGVDALDPQVGPPATVDERGLDAAALLARERPAHHLADELGEALPADPALRPAARRVRRPGDRPPQPVLPLREERIVARRDEDRLGGRLGRRAVVAQQRRQPALDAAQDRRRRGQDREELLLHDLLAGDLLGLLEEDVRDGGRVGWRSRSARRRRFASCSRNGLAPPPAPTVESVIPAAFIGSRISSYWPLLDQPSVSRMMWRRVAVALLERLHRLVQAREDVRLAERRDPGDRPLQVRDAAQGRRLDDPVRLLVEGDDAQLVALGQRRGGPQDRLLADVDLLDARRCRPPPPMPPSKLLQWQASMEPDLSMTTTRATSGCFWRSRTPMSTGSASSSGVSV